MEQNAEKTRINNVIIMDRSGSMWDIQKAAIQGYNEVLGGVKDAAQRFADTQEHFFTLVLFDSTGIDEVYWNARVGDATILTDKTYVPGASTPLYDAMGHTLTKLQKQLEDDKRCSVAVTVITDGYENSSREYDGAAVKALVEHLKGLGWSFAYMGTDHDVQSVSVSLSISNVIKFEKNEEDTLRNFRKESNSRKKWSKRLNDFDIANAGALFEDRVSFCAKSAERYYDDEEPEDE